MDLKEYNNDMLVLTIMYTILVTHENFQYKWSYQRNERSFLFCINVVTYFANITLTGCKKVNLPTVTLNQKYMFEK